jgi:hypothetical protein
MKIEKKILIQYSVRITNFMWPGLPATVEAIAAAPTQLLLGISWAMSRLYPSSPNSYHTINNRTAQTMYKVKSSKENKFINANST